MGWLLFSFLAGCGFSEEKKETGAGKEISEGYLSNGMTCKTEKGVLFTGNTEKAYFYDFYSDTVYPLCARPNCRHDSERECAAMRFNRLAYLPVMYQESLYYVRMEENGGLNYYRSNMDGEEERLVAELGYDQVDPLNALLYEGKAYLLGDSFGEMREEGWDGTACLFSVDLETGEKESLFEVGYGMNGGVLLTMKHLYGGRLYFEFFSRDADTDLENGMYFVDLKTREIQKIDWGEDFRMMGWRGEWAVFYDHALDASGLLDEKSEKTIWRVHLDSGEKEALCRSIPGGGSVVLEDGLLWTEWKEYEKEGVWKFYEWRSGETREISRIDLERYFFLEMSVCVDGEERLIGYFTETDETGTGRQGHYLISEEDFRKGKTEYRFLCRVNGGR